MVCFCSSQDIELSEADKCGVGGTATAVGTPFLTSTIDITAINDPPTVDTNRDGLQCGATYFEGQAPLQLLDSMDSLSIQDPEMDYISSAVVSITSNLDSDDMLQPSSILMSFASVEFESGILTINYTTPLNVSSTQGNSQVLFSNSNSGLNVNLRNISVTFTDVNGATSIPHVFTLCICPVNDPPVMQAVSLYVYMSVCLCVCLFVCVCLSVSPSIHQSTYLLVSVSGRPGQRCGISTNSSDIVRLANSYGQSYVITQASTLLHSLS